jgi:hypothetical protein
MSTGNPSFSDKHRFGGYPAAYDEVGSTFPRVATSRRVSADMRSARHHPDNF